jgi:hypothetical protein
MSEHAAIYYGALGDGVATYWAECEPCEWIGPERKSGEASVRTYKLHAAVAGTVEAMKT